METNLNFTRYIGGKGLWWSW